MGSPLDSTLPEKWGLREGRGDSPACWPRWACRHREMAAQSTRQEPPMTVQSLLGGIRFAVRNPQELQKHLRTRSSPGRLLQDALARLGIPISENERSLRSLEGCHEGRRCFVIGNGPSLRLADLERLQGEVSIASNRIYVAFSEMKWRPTYFTCMDTIYAENYGEELNDLDLFKIYPDYLRAHLPRPHPSGQKGRTIYFRPLPGRFSPEGAYQGAFSDDALRGLHTGPTVTIVNLQLAHYMGCRPIYLLGVDGNYTVSKQTIPHWLHGQVAVSEGEQNHFHPDYRGRNDRYVPPLVHEVEVGYATCREFLQAQGVEVLNASRQTQVTAFDRIDLERVLG